MSKRKVCSSFSIRSDVLGGRDAAVEPSLVTDPHTNQLVSSAEDIKCVSLKYCTNLLTNWPPKNEYKEDLEMNNLLHDAHMQEVIEDDIEDLS